MKLRHLLHVVFLLVLALSLPFLTLLLSRGRAPSSQYANDAGDALLRRLAAIDAGRDHILADAATLLANATISSFPSHNKYHGSGGNDGHRLVVPSASLAPPPTSAAATPRHHAIGIGGLCPASTSPTT